MFISKLCSSATEDTILDSVATCPDHKTPFMYICMGEKEECRKSPLMCPTCLQGHKGHPFESINSYFTPEFRISLKDGISFNGYAVNRLEDHVLSDINRMRGKLNKDIDKLEASLRN